MIFRNWTRGIFDAENYMYQIWSKDKENKFEWLIVFEISYTDNYEPIVTLSIYSYILDEDEIINNFINYYSKYLKLQKIEDMNYTWLVTEFKDESLYYNFNQSLRRTIQYINLDIDDIFIDSYNNPLIFIYNANLII